MDDLHASAGLACPCCGHHTLHERGNYEICPVCNWEDDGQEESDVGVVRGGPNGGLSLAAAREIFRRRGKLTDTIAPRRGALK